MYVINFRAGEDFLLSSVCFVGSAGAGTRSLKDRFGPSMIHITESIAQACSLQVCAWVSIFVGPKGHS